MAVIRSQDINRHIEPHAVSRTGVAEAIESAQWHSRSEVDDVDARRFQCVFGEIPIGNETDLFNAQPAGYGHALRTDIAADCDQRGESVAAASCRGQA
jgi:hypothetical protein